jgi:ribonuclease G
LDRELLIAAGPGEWRAALLEDGAVVELFVERGDRSESGSIHLGRVRRLVPALAAALVDIGGDRPAFLPLAEVAPRAKRLHEGEQVLVQIRREAQGGKAARVTMAVTLRGKFLELIAGRPGLHGGEPADPEERNRLLAALDRLTRAAAGFRVIAEAPLDLLAGDAAMLHDRWQDLLTHAARLEPPARVEPIASFAHQLASALPGLPARIAVDEPGVVPELRTAFPESTVERRAETDWPIDLGAAFDRSLEETVTLSNGGSVHFEATRAGLMIDVDSGSPEGGSPERVGLAVNLAAAAAIASEIRLRNAGGGILVDFVGLDGRGARERVRTALIEAVVGDPARPQILGWTRLGHLELVRPRRGRPLAEALLERSPRGGLAKTATTMAYEVLHALRREARINSGRRWRIIVAPDVVAALAGSAAPAVQETERRFARELMIEAAPAQDREQFQIIPA